MQKFMSKRSSWLNRLYQYLIVSMVLAVPIFPKFPFIRIPYTYVSIRLEDFLIAIIALITIVKIIPKLKIFFLGDIQRRILIYIGVGLVSLFSGILLTKTVVPAVGILHWGRRIEYFIPFFAALLLMKEEPESLLPFILKIIMLIYLIIFIYGLGQMYLHWPVIITQNVEYSKGIALRWIPGSHINSTFAGHYDLATFLVFLTPILINLLVLIKEKWVKYVLIICLIGTYWLFNVAVSRISIFSFIFGATISLLILKKWKVIPIFIVLSLLIFGSSSGLRDRFQKIIEVINVKTKNIMVLPKTHVVYAEDKVATKSVKVSATPTVAVATPTPEPLIEDRSSSIRFVVEWPRAIRAFFKNPLLGTGFSSITLATDNDYLRALGETGILGFTSFILILGSILMLIRKAIININKYNIIEKSFIAGYAGGFIAILINAFFIDIFEASKFAIIFWFVSGLFVYTVQNRKYEQNN